MILKMICALLAMLLEAFGVYGEGKFQWNYGYIFLLPSSLPFFVFDSNVLSHLQVSISGCSPELQSNMGTVLPCTVL